MVNLEIYERKLRDIYQYARENEVCDTVIDKILFNSFDVIEKRRKRKAASFCAKSIIVMIFTILTSVIYIDKNFLGILLLRNLQNSIYPGLKLVRKMAVPIIQQYPTLSELYDEWCILENPYFSVNDMDCWPCNVVHFVPDLTGHHVSRSFNPGIPYTKVENISEVHVEDIKQLLLQNLEVFEQDAKKIIFNNLTHRCNRDTVENKISLNPSKNLNNHITWRINRMAAGRILRQLFPKPIDMPSWWEQSTEKFIFIDEARSSPYSLPNPECSNVVIRCTSGTRLIKMIASPECTTSCASYTVFLSAGKTLWYNWWYWRPVSLPALNSTANTIIYMTSFC